MTDYIVDLKDKVKVVAASGGMDPLHAGHVEYLEKAKKLGDKLIVILNRDEWLLNKKGYFFMPYWERKKVLEALECVDEVVPAIDNDQSVCETLRQLKPDVFAKGGDRRVDEVPETKICKELGIEIVDGCGPKVQSSSNLVKMACENYWKLHNAGALK